MSSIKMRSDFMNDCYTSKHYNGANIRQNMFNLTDDIRLVNLMRNKDDTEVILEPSIISNIKQYVEMDLSQFDNDIIKEKNKFTPLQQ